MTDEAVQTFSKGEYAEARKADGGECGKCPSCEGEQYISQDLWKGGHVYATAEPCPGKVLRRRLDLFNAAKCPGKHHACGFGNYEVFSPAMGVISTWVKQWAVDYIPNTMGQRGILLGGRHGTGKTHLLVALVRHLTIGRGIPCQYLDWGDLVQKMRSGFSKNTDSEEVLRPYMTTPVLVLDELGKGEAKEWKLDALEGLIDRRYRNEAVVTLVGTNLGDKDLRGKVGERIMSRLAECSRQMVLQCDDYRRRRG
jgi:DNA replication protein DnaC